MNVLLDLWGGFELIRRWLLCLVLEGARILTEGTLLRRSGELSDSRSSCSPCPPLLQSQPVKSHAFVSAWDYALSFLLPLPSGPWTRWGDRKEKQQQRQRGGSGVPGGCAFLVRSPCPAPGRWGSAGCDLPEGGTPALRLPVPRCTPCHR